MPTNPDREALLRKAEQWCDDLGEGSADTADGPEIVHDLVTALREEMAREDRECHHGWRGAHVPDEKVIRTPCPGCGGQLFIGNGGHLTCSVIECNHDPGIERYWKEQQAELSQARANLRRVAEMAWEKSRQYVTSADPVLDGGALRSWRRRYLSVKTDAIDAILAQLDAEQGGE